MRVPITQEKVQYDPFKKKLDIQAGHERYLFEFSPHLFHRTVVLVFSQYLTKVLLMYFLRALTVKAFDHIGEISIGQRKQTMFGDINTKGLRDIHATLLVFRKMGKRLRLGF